MGRAGVEGECGVSLSRTEAVLVAAERLTGIWQEMADRTAKRNAAPWAEVGDLPSAADLHDDERAARCALVSALRGEEKTA